MNPYYQYLIMNGYANAIGETARDPETPPTGTGTTGGGLGESAPVTSIPTTEESKAPSEPEPTPPTTSTGDTQQEAKSGTTINIFNPYGTSSTTTTADDVSVDTLTGEIETGTDGVFGGGGGGGIFGGEGEDGEEGRQAIVKSWLPLIVIAAGIGVIILKPFKNKK